MKHLNYLWYMIRHKWYVLIECINLGIIWRGIMHDMSKFLPSEWFAYVNYYHGFHVPPLSWETHKAFELASLHHRNRNPHHWQYWIFKIDNDIETCKEMPEEYAREMVADWIGAGMAKHGNKDCIEWYKTNKRKINLHYATKKLVERLIGV